MERAGSIQDLNNRKRVSKAALNDWKRYVDSYGKEFVEKFAHVISVPAGDADGVEAMTSVGGVPWVTSCHLCQAVPLPDASEVAMNGEDSDDIVVLCVKDKNYRCHRSVLRESVYLDTMLSMRWIECVGTADGQPVALQLDERMFLPTLHALYGWIPAPALDAACGDQLEWLASTADFCSLPVLHDHLRARLERFLLPDVEAASRGVPARLPVEELLRVAPVCRHLGVTRPLALLSGLEVVPLWWRSAAGVEALMRLGEAEVAAVLAEASAQKEAAFDKWFDLLRRLALTTAASLDASARGHQRRQFLLDLRPLLTAALVRHAMAVPAAALDAVAALWRGARFVRDAQRWEGAEEAWSEVTSQPGLGPLLLAALESILAGKKVSAWTNASEEEVNELQEEVEERVLRALRVLLPYVMQTDVWKAKTSEMKRALLKELNFFGTDAASCSRSQPPSRPPRIAARNEPSDASGPPGTAAPLPNLKFASAISKQVMTSLKVKETPVDVSKVALPPSKNFCVVLDEKAPLRWSEKK